VAKSAGRVGRVTALLVGILATITMTSAPPALAVGDGWAWIGFGGPGVSGDTIHTQQVTGVPAWYHMDVWNDGFSPVTHGDYFYNPGSTINDYWWTVPRGSRVCARLWHWTGSSWMSEGSPCATR
jgi:hypothetical protein